jgi:hypothetical protein
MLIEGDKPKVERGAKALGVRPGSEPNSDIPVDDAGNVSPGTGGMSVSPSLDKLPMHRVPRRLAQKYPKRFGGATASNNFWCWWRGTGPWQDGPFAHGLQLHPDPEDPEGHGFVEPDRVMPLELYEGCLGATRDEWRRWDEEDMT